MKSIKISPFFFIVLLICVFLKIYKNFLLCFFALLFHEAGHLIFIRKKEIGINYIKIEPFGITLRLKENFIKNPDEEILILFAGPLFNFLLAFLSFIISKDRLSFFIYANLSMGIFNLLPVYPLDGGGILRAYLSKKQGYLKAYRIVFVITKWISLILTLLGIYIFYVTDFNFSVCLIGAFLIFNLSKEKKRTYFYLLKELSEYKEKNKDIEKMPVSYIAVNQNFLIRKIIQELSFSKYHIFSVIHQGKIIKNLTEGELMEGLIKYGGKAKINDLIS